MTAHDAALLRRLAQRADSLTPDLRKAYLAGIEEVRRCRALVDSAEDDVEAGNIQLAITKLAKATALAPNLMLSPLIATSVLRRISSRAFRYYGRRWSH